MMLRHAAAFCVLHLVPKSILRRRLVSALSVGPYVFHPQFSGRTGLYRLALALRSADRPAVALAPDYVCNIVPRALALAGYEVVTYRTDARLEPDWADLIGLAETHRATLLVGASVFGSSGLLPWLNDPARQAELRARGMNVIVDIAQDICLRSHLPANAEDFVHAVVSFNNKSFPGPMGGGVLTALTSLPAPEGKPGFRRMLRLYRNFAVETYLAPLARSLGRRPSAKARLDYSQCAEFPYEIENGIFVPPRAQLVAGLLGLSLLHRFARRKRAMLARGRHVETVFAESAAYLVLADGSDPTAAAGRLRKSPYALEGDPRHGLREDDVIVHNKGFLDEDSSRGAAPISREAEADGVSSGV